MSRWEALKPTTRQTSFDTSKTSSNWRTKKNRQCLSPGEHHHQPFHLNEQRGDPNRSKSASARRRKLDRPRGDGVINVNKNVVNHRGKRRDPNSSSPISPNILEWNTTLERIHQLSLELSNKPDEDNCQHISAVKLEMRSSFTVLSELLVDSSESILLAHRRFAVANLIDWFLPLNPKHLVDFDDGNGTVKAFYETLLQCMTMTPVVEEQASLGIGGITLSTSDEVFRCTLALSESCKVLESKVQRSSSPTTDNTYNELRLLSYKCLTRLLQSNAANLPAEQTACEVVSKILFPMIDDLSSISTCPSLTTSTNIYCRLELLESLGPLLDNSKHASAMLAPLIQDVSTDGREYRVNNPLRRRLFTLLQQHLLLTRGDWSQRDEMSHQLLRSACQCLTKALLAAHKLDTGTGVGKNDMNATSNDTNQSTTLSKCDLDVPAMEDFLVHILSLETHHSFRQQLLLTTLKLLQAFVKKYPEASAGVGSKVLLQPQRKKLAQAENTITEQPRCSFCCKYLLDLPLLSRFAHGIHLSSCHGTNVVNDTNEVNSRGGHFEKEITSTAIQCMTDLMSTMPLRMWLGSNSSHHDATLPVPGRGGMSGFGRRVVEYLEMTIHVTLCLFRQPMVTGSHIDSLAGLAQSLLLQIPFNLVDDHARRLQHAASQLCSSLGELALFGYQGPHQHGLRIQNSTADDSVQIAVIDVMITCMGGRVTPQGQLTPMCIPVRVWLSTPSGIDFVQGIIDVIHKGYMEGGANVYSVISSTAKIYKLLRAILRTRPETAVVNRHWERLQQTLFELTNSPEAQARLAGLEIVEGLILGRKDFGSSPPRFEQDAPDNSIVLRLVSSILQRAQSDSNEQCRCIAFQVYGGLLSSDWIVISKQTNQQAVPVLQCARLMLSHCLQLSATTDSSGEINAKVRSAACKAVGDICTQCLPSPSRIDGAPLSENDCKVLFSEVLLTMLEAIDDPNASVRSMALFAVGNLSHSVRWNNLERCLELPSLRQISTVVQRHLKDTNDKVAGNAIRSLGHLGHLLFSYESLPGFKSLSFTDWDNLAFFRLVIESLSDKVERLNNHVRSRLSWKQRSVARKHGWGACNTLAQFFSCDSIVREEATTGSSCSNAVCILVDCIERFWALNEKVTLSAMGALQALDPVSLTQVAGRSGAIGSAICTCILRLYETKHASLKPASSKVIDETSKLLSVLLSAASIMDACIVLKCDDISKRTLEFLYEWMVFNNIDGRAFEVFALGLQRHGLRLDVSLENSFASRALQLSKSHGRSAEDNPDEL